MKHYSFLVEGQMSKFVKKIIGIRNTKTGLSGLNKFLDGFLLTGSNGDPVQMATIRLNYLRKQDPQLAKKIFHYFNDGCREQFTKEEIKTIQNVAANLGIKKGSIGDLLKNVANDTAYGVGNGAKIGSGVGEFTGVIGPGAVAAGAIGAPHLAQYLKPDVLQAVSRNAVETGMNIGTNVGNYLSHSIPVVGPKVQNFVTSNPVTTAALAGAVPSAALSLTYRGVQGNKWLGKQVGKGIGGIVGGTVTTPISAVKNARKSHIDPRPVDLHVGKSLKRGYEKGPDETIKKPIKKSATKAWETIKNLNPFS